MKMMPVMAVLATACFLASEAQAQFAAERPQPLDSVTQGYHDAMVVMRDELLRISSLSDRSIQSAATASDETLISQVTRLREACSATAAIAREQVESFDPSAAKPHLTRQVAAVAEALGQLSENLTGHCVGAFNDHFVSMSDSVRQWTPYHARQLQRYLRQYSNVANELAHAADFRVEPRINP